MTSYFHDEVVRLRDSDLSILVMCVGLVCTTPSAAWLASRPYADDNQGGVQRNAVSHVCVLRSR